MYAEIKTRDDTDDGTGEVSLKVNRAEPQSVGGAVADLRGDRQPFPQTP